MAAFTAYAGTFEDGRQSYRWSCYATCPVYEVRVLDPGLPAPASGRKWVSRRQHGQSGPRLAMLVDHQTEEFSQMLAQVSGPQAADGRLGRGPQTALKPLVWDASPGLANSAV